MTRDDIIRMAREAGWTAFESQSERFEHFAALVAAAEREACAKECDKVAEQMLDEGEGPTGYVAWVTDCAKAIRERGEK